MSKKRGNGKLETEGVSPVHAYRKRLLLRLDCTISLNIKTIDTQ